MFNFYEIWNEGTCGSCKHWVILKKIIIFVNCPQLDVYLGLSELFLTQKCELEGQNWDIWLLLKLYKPMIL